MVGNNEILLVLKTKPRRYFKCREFCQIFSERRQKIQAHIRKLIRQKRVEFKVGDRKTHLVRWKKQ